jgi:hypothetical protein
MSKKVKTATGDLGDACWPGYTAVGMKMLKGKKVPNCVPVKESKHSEPENPVDLMTPRSMNKPQASMPEQFIMSEAAGTESMEPNGRMIVNQLRVIREKTDILLGHLDGTENLPPWCFVKITNAGTGLASVADFIQYGYES